MSTFSEEHKLFLKKIKQRKRFILFFQIMIFVLFLMIWEFSSRAKLINPFLFSSPSMVFSTIVDLFQKNNLFLHIGVTLYETIISFAIASIIGLVMATLFWWSDTTYKIFEPYLTILNSLPKVALGPLIIIWIGASVNSIIIMALLISTFISIINIYNGFKMTDNSYITLLKSFGASKIQIFRKAVFPANFTNVISALKINISMSLIGVIMGELLVSKSGLGYLIMYGSQVFNINLTITSAFILGIISYLMYFIICKIENKLK